MAAKEHVQSLPEFDSLGYVALTPLKDSSPPSPRAARFQTKDGPPEDKSESLDPKKKGGFYSESDRRQRLAVGKPESSGWANFHSGIGYISLMIAGLLFYFALKTPDGERSLDLGLFSMFILFIGLSNLFASFMINVQTDMRYYLKEIATSQRELTDTQESIAATQKKMAESFERIEGREDS